MTSSRPRSTAAAPPAEPRTVEPPLPRALAALGVVLFCAIAVLSAVIEVLLVPLRVGTVILPITVPLAVATNVLLPLMCRRIVDTSIAAALAPIVWVVTVFVLASGRPEGDVLLPGGNGVEGNLGYALLLLGILAGVITVVVSETRRPAP